MLFIVQVAAVSCADTQVPETTVANQSLLKVGFCKAIQLEVLVIRIGATSVSKRNYPIVPLSQISAPIDFVALALKINLCSIRALAAEFSGCAG